MAIIIKTPGEVEAMKAAGRLSAMVLREVGAHCKPGVNTLELDEIAETFIRDHGGVPAFKGYGGFPGSICASVNEQIIHGIPSKDVVLQGGDIISIDTGAIVDGWVGDNAWTFAVGTVSPQKKRLLEVGEKCMWAGIEAAQVGNRLGDVGHAIQSVAEAAGYGVVREYVGHGIGRNMHEEPNVPNYGRKHRGIELLPGMVLAIEPMLNLGTHRVYIEPDHWTVRTADGKKSAHFEHMVLITEGQTEVLTSV